MGRKPMGVGRDSEERRPMTQTAAQLATQRRRYQKRKGAGLCVDCGEPAVCGITRCEKCRGVLAEYGRMRKRQGRQVPVDRDAEREAWGALKIWQCLIEYDLDSPTREEFAAQRESQQVTKRGAPAPKEIQWEMASLHVARSDAKGRVRPDSREHKGGIYAGELTEFAKGDQRQRYVVTAFDPTLGVRFTYGWTEEPQRLAGQIYRHPRYCWPAVLDRKVEV